MRIYSGKPSIPGRQAGKSTTGLKSNEGNRNEKELLGRSRKRKRNKANKPVNHPYS